ncbi:MAG: hypothetical protein PHX16_01570 [Syntrophaceticus sp.]|nr:hypothetical protein [Syntrophaceticus sp.]MDD3315406.1 hypothetical protein [Syntrophaceticus sp.]MDD4359087.1 hypothetical protein [Syntrophaceticus sp.]MDD4782321.1 hypothetical protein [Syntrophaceticus sp.]
MLKFAVDSSLYLIDVWSYQAIKGRYKPHTEAACYNTAAPAAGQ